MSLPQPAPPGLLDLVRFDLTRGLPTALGVLSRHLSADRLALVVARILLRAGLRDPLAGLPRAGWPNRLEAMTRYQLRSAVLLDDALRAGTGLSEAERMEILGAVVAEVGACFIEANVDFPTLTQWRGADHGARERFTRATAARFFNAEVQGITVDDGQLGFDIVRCRFVQLTRALGRPHLAPMFCEADSAFFGRPDSPICMCRTSTLAGGGSRCDFRLQF